MTTNDGVVADRLRSMRDYGKDMENGGEDMTASRPVGSHERIQRRGWTAFIEKSRLPGGLPYAVHYLLP